MIWKHKFRLKASLWWDLSVRINYHPPVGALCDWVLGGGSVDERRLQSSGGGRRKRREKDQITERCWSWALSSLFRCLHGRRWKRRKSWEKGTDADGGATMEAFCPLLLLLLRGSLYPLHHLFLCTLPPFISPFMSFSYTPPPVFLLLSPPAPSLLFFGFTRGPVVKLDLLLRPWGSDGTGLPGVSATKKSKTALNRPVFELQPKSQAHSLSLSIYLGYNLIYFCPYTVTKTTFKHVRVVVKKNLSGLKM